MKKLELKRLTIDEMAEIMPIIEKSEQERMLGGGDGSSGNPYTWDEYEYLADNDNWYGGYVEGSGYTGAQVTIQGNGPNGFCFFNCLDYLSNQYGCNYSTNYYLNSFYETYNSWGINGVNISDFISFASLKFNASAPINDSQIAQSMGTGSMLAAITIGGSGHAVILTSYHNLTNYYHLNMYSYYDPTTGNYGIVSSSDVVIALPIYGCCQ
ncbi:MAG: hypothetical protein LBG80_00360 [Bacteroidales bacterium]|jgi:hypothetical protein|nr:hypothetical protein [Bacteroidales bacterium]